MTAHLQKPTVPQAILYRLALWGVVTLWFGFLLLGAQQFWPLFLVVFAALVALGKRSSVLTASYGSAKFATACDLVAADLLNKPGGLILGSAGYCARPTVQEAVRHALTAPWPASVQAVLQLRLATTPGLNDALIQTDKYVHQLVIAGTGRGKGVSYVIPNCLEIPDSMVILDFKGEIHALTACHRQRALGQEIVVLDPFCQGQETSATFNPLALLDPDSPDLIDDCASLADALVVETGKEADPHWNQMSKAVLTAFVTFTVCYAKPGERHLQTVRQLLAEDKAFTGAIQKMLASKKCHGLLARLGSQLMFLQDREKGSVLTGVNRHLNFLDSMRLQEHTQTNSFDPIELVRRKMTVYITIPADKAASHSRLLRMYLATSVRRLLQNGLQETNRVFFMLDEIAQVKPLPALEQLLAIGRGYGLRASFIFQSEGQIKDVFPDDKAQTVHNNVDHVLYWGINDYHTAEEVSKKLGEATIRITNYQDGFSWSRSDTQGSSPSETQQSSGNTGTTRSEIARRLKKPEEILQLPEDMAVVFARGVPPILAKRVVYYADPRFQDRARPGRQERRTSRVAVCLVLLLLCLSGCARPAVKPFRPDGRRNTGRSVQFHNVVAKEKRHGKNRT